MKKLLSIGLCIILMSAVSGCSLAGGSYQNGRKSFADGKYEDAASYFSAAVEGNPNRADYYIDYGMALIKLGRYEEALTEFDRAYVNKDIIIVNRNNKRVCRGKGIAYYYMLEYEKAVEEFKKALEINELSDLDMDILYYMGSSQTAIGSYEEAADTYTALIKMDKKRAPAYNSRALCYRSLGDYEKSLADYDMAISLEPDNYSHYFGKYYLMAENDNEAGAGEILTKASQIEVKTGEDRYNLAKIHYYQEDYDTALAELNDGFVNGFKEAYYYIGEIYRIKKDYPKAIYYYETFIDEGGVTAPAAYNQIASCMIKTGEYTDAIKYLEQGIAFHQSGTMRILKRNEIIAYEYMGRLEEAGKKLGEYLSLYPEDTQAMRESEFIETRLMEAAVPGGEE